jgi:hypothetical protein
LLKATHLSYTILSRICKAGSGERLLELPLRSKSREKEAAMMIGELQKNGGNYNGTN